MISGTRRSFCPLPIPALNRLGSIHRSIAVFIAGTTSPFDKFRQENQVCGPNRLGVTECFYRSNAGDSSPDPSVQRVIPRLERAQKQRCAGNCASHEDCSYDDNCVCATKAPPLTDSSWGHWKCMYNPTLVATAAALTLSKFPCRGRCALEADGALALAIPEREGGLPTLQDALNCPCNCTYASEGCCLAKDGMVWEDEKEKIQTVIMGPNGMCCDVHTGAWSDEDVTFSEGNPFCKKQVIDALGRASNQGLRNLVNWVSP